MYGTYTHCAAAGYHLKYSYSLHWVTQCLKRQGSAVVCCIAIIPELLPISVVNSHRECDYHEHWAANWGHALSAITYYLSAISQLLSAITYYISAITQLLRATIYY
jgi:hypothetical protein